MDLGQEATEAQVEGLEVTDVGAQVVPQRQGDGVGLGQAAAQQRRHPVEGVARAPRQPWEVESPTLRFPSSEAFCFCIRKLNVMAGPFRTRVLEWISLIVTGKNLNRTKHADGLISRIMRRYKLEWRLQAVLPS
ncbi:hypothetical protein scyTo_0005626 [Scyliorhinus torazame]|uniref:Uncharacterized protein n=1 Tax=Scyliorhinus torazame TaxID=75743 RepID=A0A401PAL0_SCYTO|nr:hypothetical protein [Scyliorhinus torazame]